MQRAPTTTRVGTPTRAAGPKRSWCLATHQVRKHRTRPARRYAPATREDEGLRLGAMSHSSASCA